MIEKSFPEISVKKINKGTGKAASRTGYADYTFQVTGLPPADFIRDNFQKQHCR